jgi:tetratricopeptide (TPR) repeat protein
MRMRSIALCVLLGLLLPGTSSSAERRLKGQVVLVDPENRTQPAKTVRVVLRGAGGSDITREDGLFDLSLPKAFKGGERVTLAVEKEGWCIQSPLYGQIVIPQDPEQRVTVRLLPAGSKNLWSSDRIELFIRDSLYESHTHMALALGGQPRAPDLSHSIQEWAGRCGFSPRQAQEEINRWAAETEQNPQNDPEKRGLAAYAQKNFERASQLLSEAGEQKARESQERVPDREKLERAAVEDFQLAGHAAYANYEFDRALASYQRSLEYASREKTPELWVSIWIRIAHAHQALGLRAEGPAILEHRKAARAAIDNASQVYSRKRKPDQWALLQTCLGYMLTEQSLRAEADEVVKLLGEAVAAYQRALEVTTRQRTPVVWAMTQSNLAGTLWTLGGLAPEAERVKLRRQAVVTIRRALEADIHQQAPELWANIQTHLGHMLLDQGDRAAVVEAVVAFRRAQEVYTLEQLPQEWLKVQENLIAVYRATKYWRGAATACAEILKAFPKDFVAYQCAASLNHNRLFSFVDARTLHEQWLKRHPDEVLVRCNLGESQLATGQFAEAEASLRSCLTAPDTETDQMARERELRALKEGLVPGQATTIGLLYKYQDLMVLLAAVTTQETSVVARALEIAALLAQGKTQGIPGKLDALRADIAARDWGFKSFWEFEGTRHFIRQDARMAPWRDWLLLLLDALEAQDQNAVLVALDVVRARFTLTPGPSQTSEGAKP